MNKNDVPILLIGLGGIGSYIVNETYGKLKQEGDIDFLEALVFDTDEAELSKLENIPKDSKVQTSTDKSVGYVLERDKNANMWFPVHPKILAMNLIKGAGQIRAVSRLALRAAMKEGKLNKIQKVKDKLYRLGSNAAEKGVRIVLVSSLMGGTGSGMFLQIPLYLREVMQSKFSADRIEIQGVFMLPDVLMGSVNGKEEVNVYANAYASMKEMNAIIMSLAKEGPTIELEYRPDQITDEAENKGIGINDWPYDYCYIYDKEDAKGRNIGELDEYKHMIADNLYSQVYGPVSDALHSHFINEIRSIIRKNSKNIFGGLAIGKIIYPYDEICEYITNKAIYENLKEQLLRIDESYKNKLEQYEKDRQSGNETERPEIGSHYMDEFDTMAKDKTNIFFKQLDDQVLSIDENGEKNGYLSDDYLDYVDNLFEEQAEDFKSKNNLTQLNRQKLDNAPEGQVRSIIMAKEDEFKEFKRSVDAKMDSMGEMKANSDFKFYDDRGESYLDTFLKKDNVYINPVGIRYLLYRIQDELIKMKAEYAEEVENKRNDLTKIEINKVTKLFKNKDTFEQALDHALNASKNPADKFVFKTFQKFKDEYQDASMKHYKMLIEYAKDKFANGYLRKMIELIGALIKEYEGMFNKLDEQKISIEKRIAELENKDNGKQLKPNIYVLKTKAYMQKLWESIPIAVRINTLSNVLPEKMHENLKINCKQKLKSQDANVVGYDTLFNKLILEGCKESLKEDATVKDILDMNIVRAIAKEYEFAKELGEVSNVKDEDTYIREKLKTIINLTEPFAANSDDASDFVVWGLNDNLRLQSESSEGKTKIQTMIEEATDLAKRLVLDSDYSKYEIEYIHSRYGLLINDFAKFSDKKGDEGRYYKCYEQVIKDVSNDYGSMGRNVEITPHIDKDWHKILPPIGGEKLMEENIQKAKAFITCLPLGFVVVEKRNISADKVKLEFKRKLGSTVAISIEALGEKVEGNVSNLYDGLIYNPKLVENINEEISKYIDELKKDKTIGDANGDCFADKYIKKLLDFKLITYSEISNVLDLFIVLFRESKNVDEKDKIIMFSNLANGLCEIVENIVSAYVEVDKEAISYATKEVLKKLIENSKLASKVNEDSPEYTYTLSIIKDKINKYEEK